MEALQWAIGILVLINMAVTGFLAQAWRAHESECKQVNARLASMQADLERMKQDIGTHDTGLRGHVHKVAQMVGEHELKFSMQERHHR